MSAFSSRSAFEQPSLQLSSAPCESMGKPRTQRNANIEALRIMSICMVTLLHALGKSGLLVDMAETPSANGYFAWGLESLAIPAVNVFMLISGYFLAFSSFKLLRLVELVCQILFYTVGTHLVCQWTGIVPSPPDTLNDIANWLFPIQVNVFWFMNVYICIYILLPVFSGGMRSLPKKHLGLVILLLGALDCLPKSIAPIRLFDGHGYSFLWCFTVFLAGAYFRRFGFAKLDTPLKGLLLYVAASAGIFLETVALQHFNFHKGLFTQIRGISMDYNHVFVLFSSIGLFAAVVHSPPMRPSWGKIICFLSPMVLGVYLLQENLTLRHAWQRWFGLPWALDDPMPKLGVKLFLAVAGMTMAGMTVDFFRQNLFHFAQRLCFSTHKSRVLR